MPTSLPQRTEAYRVRVMGDGGPGIVWTEMVTAREARLLRRIEGVVGAHCKSAVFFARPLVDDKAMDAEALASVAHVSPRGSRDR